MEQKDNFEMVINLRKAHDSKRPKKFKSAVNLIRGTVSRHFGAEKVILDPFLLSYISSNSKDKITRRVRVVVTKIGEKTFLVKLAVKP
ncbi:MULTISPECIES: 50S ribosomal protein L31e [Metallosphaera]|uniref:Large ribosomal subunit protein eL31 n=3 Tax=Metallosphaera TaxID=41980 RepID=A4YH80_METS5|nr:MULTISPECIES: 50S ribosomal protein L31e [Metallosphaera]ABP95782.1 LSU ribosomal protein L31E [Metallosphaera sedula DSM 5348]AIM27766.1 LSU ribosomal protein L31E [Metallosphaera sedula]AKV74622.1 50S ribosomal protein L31 [Metallosphaera sedula]AKV76860.1 50S ribosomal protein L31 [Metallosphaera sedula]AKV79111.1 50S ribosomal protein L31 [Metallosphaera sedula]